jgi:hypothetical protein
MVWVSLVVLFAPAPSGSSSASQINVGLTFSPREAAYRDLPWRHAFDAALDAAPSLVRVGAYWSEIESTPGEYDFTTLDWLLDRATARQQRVLLTVGMKAPRWPEYYLPVWLSSRLELPDGAQVSDHSGIRTATLAFVSATVAHVRLRDVIAAWQVENEPLDPSGPHAWSIGKDFLAEEVALVRDLDHLQRRIVVTTFIETQPVVAWPPARAQMVARSRDALAIADVLGLDVYPSRTVHLLGTAFTVTWPAWLWSDVLTELRVLATAEGKDAWIVEAQAEPWLTGGRAPPPIWPGTELGPTSTLNVLSWLQAAGYRTVLLWGTEHWEARRAQHQDSSWWTAVTNVLTESAARSSA